MEHMYTAYNYYWVFFSIMIGILFSYIALDLRWKMIEFKDILYKIWLLGCAIAMGIGIWTMHFVGMVAMKMPHQIIYDIRLVFLSLLSSILGTGISFLVMKSTRLRLLMSSIFMACGIVCMHYLGIQAMNVHFSIYLQPGFIVLSMFIAVISAYYSLWFLFIYKKLHTYTIRSKIVSSIIMGLGISGMHYSGMWGTVFIRKEDPQIIHSNFQMSSETLSSFISIPAFFVLFIMFLSSAFLDKKLVSHIMELRERDKKLEEADKLSLVGELASSVAHEIRNPLTSLMGFTKIISENTEVQSNKEYLKIMMSELNRINFIVSEFMVLSKPHLLNFITCDLTTITKSVVTLLNTQAIIKKIEIITVIEGKSLLLKCEENQIKQVLVNLIKNSIEAMPNGGRIYVKLERKSSNIVISIIDEGEGICNENIHLVGKPFYTTKPEGTGLGIMVSERIIQNHNGKLEIKSVPGKGTRVIVSLPIDERLKQVRVDYETKEII